VMHAGEQTVRWWAVK